MKKSEKPGLLEQVQAAVQPLVAEGQFCLETIEYGYQFGDVEIRLCSKDLDIVFHTMLRASTEVHTFFRLKSERKSFYAKYVFPALHVDIPINKGKSLQDFDYRSIKESVRKHQKVIDTLLEKNEFIPELGRLCVEINARLPDICSIFSPENLEETINLYSIEYRKHEKIRQRIF